MVDSEHDLWTKYERMQGTKTLEVKFNITRIWEWWKKTKNEKAKGTKTMSWISLALRFLLVLPKLMTVAEKAFDGVPDSGAEKKKMVKTTAHAIVTAMLGISSIGRDDTWEKIEGILDPAIDIMCTFLFPNDKQVTP